MKDLTLLLCFCGVLADLQAQTLDRAAQQAAYKIHTVRAAVSPVIDGVPDEPCWQQADTTSEFWLKWPRDGAPAPQQTQVRCTYDNQFLYIGVVAFDSTPDYVVQSLKRDVGYWDSDGFGIVLDPSNTAINGYFFGFSANGVQSEALLSSSNTGEMDLNWDNAWVVKTRSFADRWTAECAIPLRILRFKQGQKTWGINFIRNDLTNGLYSVWARIPFQFDGVDLGWTGALEWDEAPPKAKGNYNIIPYATASVSRNYEEGEAAAVKPNAGLDAKIGIGSGLNLDVTLNPDFSQVEIDEQVVNLTRFDVQLPEKRTFFLENGDLFANFGIPPIRPFFSRTIGLDENARPLPIFGGLRLTGNLNADTRLGIMSMLTGAQGGTPARQFTSLALNQRIFGRTSVGGYFLDRTSFTSGGKFDKSDFSRNAGLEFSFTSLDAKWAAWGSHHRSFKPGISQNNWWSNAGLQYTVRGFSWLSDFLHMGENYYADMGFESRIENYDILRDTSLRIGYNFWFNDITYQMFPKRKDSKLNYIEFGANLFNVLNPNGSFNESSNELGVEINFKNTSTIEVNVRPNWANVPVAFKFDDSDDLELCPPLPAAAYAFTSGVLEYDSDYRKAFSWGFELGGGEFYNGKQWQAALEMKLRIQPIMNIGINAQYNQLDFPDPYCDVDFFNITPRLEVFFAKNIWWTTFLQYNTQADNFNINSRFQWRFRPMSDLFIVYTDNYGVAQRGVKNRALAAKMNWWF